MQPVGSWLTSRPASSTLNAVDVSLQTTRLTQTSDIKGAANALSRMEAVSGKINQAQMQIAEDTGYVAIFLASEGNGIALHSKS